MNRNKVSPSILKQVNILNKNNQQKVFVTCSNFNKAKSFFNSCKYSFSGYRFADCFSLSADVEDIDILSNQEFVNYIYPNKKVCVENLEQNFVHIENLTKNKFLGQNQTICFIDTGIFPHFDFIFPNNRILKFVDFINNSSLPYDDNGHGTFVSGIACGRGIYCNLNIGFAPKANIVSIKALGENGSSNSNTILDAMEWIYQNHKVYNIGVVCMSFGADTENGIDPLSKGAEALWKEGLVVVAAAGNSGPNKETIKSPGNNPNIITVGALDTSNFNVADFSSRGPTIYGHKPDLLAPAVDIVSCNNKGLPYTKMSGTSVATPIIAGICADIKSKHPNMTNTDIKKYLISHCTKLTGDVDTEGAGYINFKTI